MTGRNATIVAMISMVITIILYALTATGYMGDNPVGRGSNYEEPLIVPAGYAFSIWSIIYLGLIIFPFYQWFKKSDHPLWTKIKWLYGVNVILNGLWLVVSSYDMLGLSVIIIVGMLATLYIINRALIALESEGVPINYWIERLVFSLYFSWITLATVLNVSSALTFYEWDGFGISDVTWTWIMIPVAALVTSVVFFTYRDKAYASVVVWAFIALAVKHLDQYPMIGYLSIGVALLFIVYILTHLKMDKIAHAKL